MQMTKSRGKCSLMLKQKMLKRAKWENLVKKKPFKNEQKSSRECEDIAFLPSIYCVAGMLAC